MILHSLCNTCLQAFLIMTSSKTLDNDMTLLRLIDDGEGTAPCPRGCGGRINVKRDRTILQMVEDHRLRDPLRLTVKELYQAVMGAGLPDEIPSDPEVIHSFLMARKVVDVELEVQDRKIYLHEIKLDGGVTLHLTAGPRGAQVLKITKERVHGTPDSR